MRMNILKLFNTPMGELLKWNELELPQYGIYEFKLNRCTDEPKVKEEEPIPMTYYITSENCDTEKVNLLIKSVRDAVYNPVYLKIYDNWFFIESDVLETNE